MLGIGGILFIIVAALVLRRSLKQLNQIFSLFFISIAISSIINAIYASLRAPSLVLVLHLLTYYLFSFAMCFLFLFNLILLKSVKKIDRKIQLLFIAVWGLILLGIFPLGILDGVKIDETTGWKPMWEFSFFLYGFTVCFLYMIIPTLYWSIKIYKQFQDKEMKKRWRIFISGICFYYIVWGGNSIVNVLSIDFVRSFWSIILFFSFFTLYIIYYGVAKQLD